ncbi:HAD family hydrolase [Pseudonocardia sp. TRM90224]|uniref:HAD family hydrolase n=1 Tax=Pseudonocardia sp. TRM90224 TaxID=2812678 RepID=UPI001E4ED698|nr:HAD family phosphatase [Pseudonocardia sp. TRM90224]
MARTIGLAGAAGPLAVVFDMDGVLIDTDAPVAALWERAIGRRLGASELGQHVYGRAPAKTVEALCPAMTPPERQAVLRVVETAEPELDFAPVAGATRFVSALHAAGVVLALVTSASPVRVKRVLDATGLTEAFVVRVADGDAASKPAPDCYRLAATRLGVLPRRCLVFEDSVSGVRSAVAAGTRCVGVAGRLPSRAAELTVLGAEHTIIDFAGAHVRGGRDGTAVDLP